MLFDAISPIVSVADLPVVESPIDAVLAHRPQHKLLAASPVRVSFGSSKVTAAFFSISPAPPTRTQCQQADINSRRNELVQDRDAGDSWYQISPAIPGRE